jgi:hypothetical protein
LAAGRCDAAEAGATDGITLEKLIIERIGSHSNSNSFLPQMGKSDAHALLKSSDLL